MVKVCHITSDHTQFDVRIFYKECVSLAKMGYETYLISQGSSGMRDGVHLIGLGAPPASTLRRILCFTKKAYDQAIRLDADIYHFHDPEFLPYGAKLKAKGKKVIFDSHENLHNQLIEKKKIPRFIRPAVAGIYKKYLVHVCRRFDAVVTVDAMMNDFYKKINENSLTVTNYPINAPHNSRRQKQTDHEFWIGFAGGITEQWNHDKIIKALAGIPNVKYQLCGNPGASFLERLRAMPEWEKVEFHGLLPHNDALELIGSCDLGIALCSFSKNTNGAAGTLGNTKIFEIMMEGTPVLCTGFLRWKDIVDKWECGLCVNYNNIDEIRKAITFFIENPETAKRMGQNGKKAVETEFCWQQQEKILKELYDAIK